MGVLYVKSFYGIIDLFKSLKIPNHIKPAIGGLCTGIIGFFLPQTLAFGYGFAQMALNSELTIPFLLLWPSVKYSPPPFPSVPAAAGVFSARPSSSAVPWAGSWEKCSTASCRTWSIEPGAFVVVGMAGFFTAVSNTPISTIIFVSEMTNSYHLLLPSLLVCSLTYLASKKWTIFHNQVKSKIDSPAHAGDFFVDILQTIHVKDLSSYVKKVTLIPQDMPFSN